MAVLRHLREAGRCGERGALAEHLFVSVNAVKKQISAAMRKLGVRSRSALPVRLDDQL